jgi:Holliday junction resolvase-like predicted endonuclease
MATTASQRVSSADTLAMLSATDEQGRVDPLAFEAQRLILRHEGLGGIDAKGLVNGMLSTSSYRPNTKDTMIEAITQRLDKNDARLFAEALDQRGLRDNAFEAITRDIRGTVTGTFDAAKQTLSRMDDTASNAMAQVNRIGERAANNPENHALERAAGALVQGPATAGQYVYGGAKGAGSHVLNELGGSVDLAKMAYRFRTDENYRDALIGLAKVYAADTLKDPSKPYNDASLKASDAMSDWEQGLKTAKQNGTQAQYLGQGHGVIAIETVAAVVPLSKLSKFGKVADALDTITPQNMHVVSEAVGDLTRHMDRKPAAIEIPNTPHGLREQLVQQGRDAGAEEALHGVMRMARQDGELSTLVKAARSGGSLDGMLRIGEFNPKELGQLVKLDETIFKPDAKDWSAMSPEARAPYKNKVSFDEAMGASTKGLDLNNLTNRQLGDIGEAISTRDMVKQGYTDITSIKNNSNHGIDLVGRNKDGELEFFEVKASAKNQAKAQTGDPQEFITDRLRRAIDARGHWSEANVSPELNASANALRKEIGDGSINAKWVQINISRDSHSPELKIDKTVKDWVEPEARKQGMTSPNKADEGIPAKLSTVLINHESHPDYREFQQLRSMVSPALSRSGRKPNEEEIDNATAQLLAQKKENTLMQETHRVEINHVKSGSPEGDKLIALYEPHGQNVLPRFNARIPTDEAMNTPLAQSTKEIDGLNQQQALAQRQELERKQQKEQNPDGPSLQPPGGPTMKGPSIG